MSYLSVILLVLGLLVLGESAPTHSRAHAQRLQRFPFYVQNQDQEQLAIEEAFDMKIILQKIISSVWDGDINNAGDMFRRLAGILPKIDENPGEFGGKQIGDFFSRLADLADGLPWN